MMKLRTLLLIIIGVIAGALSSCIEDGFTTSPSDAPVFSTDTLDMGVIFTDEPSPTSRFTVYNRASKSINISDIRLSGDNASAFRINVDGISGDVFSNVEIRGKDSIFVFVEATLPQTQALTPQKVEASIDFTTNGITSGVIVAASGQNVRRIKGEVLTANTVFDSELPYQIFDSLTVAEGAELRLRPGTTLCFHDKAMLIVRGTLVSEGTVDKPVTMAGDRTGNVVADISFDIMSRQWQGVFFTSTSRGNRLVNTNIRNTVQGVTLTETELDMLDCRLRNSGDLVLESYHSAVAADGCEFSEGGGGLVYFQGGTVRMSQCTFANNYLFTAIGGPALGLSHLGSDEKGLDDGSGFPWLKAQFANCIFAGLGSEFSHGDLAGYDVYLRNCLIKSKGEDDDNFINCIWEADPLYYTVREDYIFDYRVKPESPAIGAGDPSLVSERAKTDAYGVARAVPPTIGAYEYVEPVEETD